MSQDKGPWALCTDPSGWNYGQASRWSGTDCIVATNQESVQSECCGFYRYSGIKDEWDLFNFTEWKSRQVLLILLLNLCRTLGETDVPLRIHSFAWRNTSGAMIEIEQSTFDPTLVPVIDFEQSTFSLSLLVIICLTFLLPLSCLPSSPFLRLLWPDF